MAISKMEQGKLIDFDVLDVINKFKFVRPIELGKLLWPDSKFSEKNASNQLKKLLNKHLVIQRRLPENSGFCYVLSKKGAIFLNHHYKNTLVALDLTKWGKCPKGIWTPPIIWRHHLIALGILAEYKKNGYTVFSERQIKAKYPELNKIPDGMIGDAENSGHGYFIEVERARKKGEDLDKLAESVIAGNRGKFFGFNVIETMVCFNFDQIDDRGDKISHQERFRTAVRRMAEDGEKILYSILDVKMKGVGVESVCLKNKSTYGNNAEREHNQNIRKVYEAQNIKNSDWEVDNNGNWRDLRNGFDLKIENDLDQFLWKVRMKSGDRYKVYGKGHSANLEGAKKAVVLAALAIDYQKAINLKE